MKLELHPDAQTELLEAAAWYAEQAPGLGEELLDDAARSLAAIVEAPLAWPRWSGISELDPPVRKLLLRKFPYAIAYRAFPDRIQILAFAHTSRRPGYWRERLRS